MSQPVESMRDRLRRISLQYADERKRRSEESKRREEKIEEMIRESAKRWAEKQIAKLPARLEAAVKSGESIFTVLPPWLRSCRIQEAGLDLVAKWARERGLWAEIRRREFESGGTEDSLTIWGWK